MSLSHIIIFGIILIIVIPPEKLPEVMRNVGRFINDLRRTTSGVWDDLKADAQLKPEDLLKHQPPQTPQPSAVKPTPTQDDDLDNSYKPKSNQAAQTQEVKSNESKS